MLGRQRTTVEPMSFPPPLHQQQNLVVNNPTDSTDELSQLSVCSGALPTACFLPPVQYFPVDVLPRGDYGSTLHGDDYSSTVSPWVFRAIESLPQLGVGNLPLSPQWTLEVDKVWEMLEGDKENYCLPHPVATSNPPQAYNFDTNNNYQSPPDHLPNADFHSPVVSLPLVPPPSPQLSNPPSTVAGVGNNWKRPLLESDFADVPSIVGTPHGLSQSMESEPEAHDPTDAMDAGFPFRETGDGLCVCGWMDSSGRPCGVSVRANYIKQHVQRVHLQLR